MKILYVTRHFNRSGYYILKHLLEEGDFNIIGVVVRKGFNPFLNRFLRQIAILFYKIKCAYYRCKPCKFLYSEEILAERNNLNIIKIEDINSNYFYDILKKLAPDIIVIGGGWHQLLSKRIISYPPLGCLNTHPSLLPLFRGTTVHRWQILHGVESSGSTIHYIDGNFDTGNIIDQKEVEITLNDTPQILFEKTARVSGILMSNLLKKMENLKPGERLKSKSQENSRKHYFHKWEWKDEFLQIDWKKSFLKIHNSICASNQELYKYKGQIMEIAGKRYFVRKSVIRKADNKEGCKKGGVNEIVLYRIDNAGLHLFKNGDKHILIIEQLQKYDKYFSFRRAFRPRVLETKGLLSTGDILYRMEAKINV